MRVNILVDTMQYFYRWVYYLISQNKNRVFMEDKDDGIELVQGVHLSLQGDIYRYKNYIDRIFLCVDSSKNSWRKYIKVEGEKFYKVKEKEYKFNYKNFIHVVNTYCDILRKKGIYVISYNHAEGDDIIYFLSNIIYEQNDSSIIISSDSDLKQLIKSTEGKFIYNFDSDRHKRKHFVDKYLSPQKAIISETTVVESMDGDFEGIFSHSISDMESSKNDIILNDVYDNSDIVNPCQIIFTKMLAGDKNDGVPSCCQYYTKNGVKMVSFTELRANNVWEKYVETENYNYQYFINLYDDMELRKQLAYKVLAEVKQGDENIDTVTSNIRRNLKFIFLNEIVYHGEHRKHLLAHINKILEDTDFLIKHKELIVNGFSNLFLEGTPYEFSNDDNSRYYDNKKFY